MNIRLVDILQCPTCGSATLRAKVLDGVGADIREGIVWCENRHWFPIEDRVIELLPPDLQYKADRDAFEQKYGMELSALGLLDSNVGEGRTHTSDELKMVQIQQKHFDWYAENDTQAYNSYALMPFWRVVDLRTFSAWNSKISTEVNHGADLKLLLDVGCAQGRSSLNIAQPGVHIVGFDISKRMVRQAYTNFQGISSDENWNDFLVADASRFPFRSGAFDYTLVYGVLHHLPDPAAACREIVRVLKRGGTYFGSENNRSSFRGIFDLLQRLVPAWHEEAGAQPLIGRRDFHAWFDNTDLSVAISSTVFIPPHLVNALGIKIGGFLLSATDAVLTSVPFFRNQGGLIVVQGTKN